MRPEAKALIERERQARGPSSAQREEMRRALTSAVAAGVTAATAGTAAASQLAAGAAIGTVGASAAPLGLMSWLGGGVAVGALVVASTQAFSPTASPSASPQTSAQGSASVGPSVPTPASDARRLNGASGSSAPPPQEATETIPTGLDDTSAMPGRSAERGPEVPPPIARHRAQTWLDEGSIADGAGAPSSAGPSPSTDSLRAEYALLETAYRAIESGQSELALGLLAQHQRRFAGGQLGEEREAARVLALCTSRNAGAPPEARRFLATHPRSLLGPRVRQQCGLDVNDSVTDTDAPHN